MFRPDPAEWAPRGYAVVNIDIRGTWESEGNLYIEGSQPGKSRLSISTSADKIADQAPLKTRN